jgi:hypothetical protein
VWFVSGKAGASIVGEEMLLWVFWLGLGFGAGVEELPFGFWLVLPPEISEELFVVVFCEFGADSF